MIFFAISLVVASYQNVKRNKILEGTIKDKDGVAKYWKKRAEELEEAVEKQYAVKIRKIIKSYNLTFTDSELETVRWSLSDALSRLQYISIFERELRAESILKVFHKVQYYHNILSNMPDGSQVINDVEFDLNGDIVEHSDLDSKEGGEDEQG